jgi:hypothetical protein
MISRQHLCDLMERFIRGDERGLQIAGEIEVGLDDHFGEEEPYADLSLTLASYLPGGGEHLFDEAEIVPMMRHALESMKRRRADSSE